MTWIRILRDFLDKIVKENEGTIERPSATGDIDAGGITLVNDAFTSTSRLQVICPIRSYFAGVADTNSMEPCFDNGDYVLLCPCDPADVVVGDICVYDLRPEHDWHPIHRVVAIEEAGDSRIFTFKGDNNPGNDPWRCLGSQIVARYNGHIVPKRPPDVT